MFGKKRGRTKKAGPLVHDDLVRHDFTATGPNRLWLTDITEHVTGEGKLHLCAIKDATGSQGVTQPMTPARETVQETAPQGPDAGWQGITEPGPSEWGGWD